MITEGSVEIDRRIEEVFQYTNNNVAEWSLIVVEDVLVEETANHVGSRSRVVTEDHGRRMEFDCETTRYEPPKLSAFYMTGSSFDIDIEYRFQDLRNKTRVTQVSNVKGKGLFRVMLPLMSVFMRKSSCNALQKELDNLKRLCEERSGHELLRDSR